MRKLQSSKPRDKQVNPEDSVSRVSSRPSNTSRSSGRNYIVQRIAAEAADQTALKLKAYHLLQMQHLENAECKLRQEKELLEVKVKLQKAEAREKVLTDVLERFGDSKGSLQSHPRCQSLNPNAEMNYPPIGVNDLGGAFLEVNESAIPKVSQVTNVAFQPSVSQPAIPQLEFQPLVCENRVQPNSGSAPTHLMDILIAYNLKGLMPKVEVQKFGGDVTQYKLFVRAFNSIISSKLTDEEEKLLYLEQFTFGKPRESVRACSHMGHPEGYKEARRLLEKKYGNEEKIAAAHVYKILG